MKILLLLAIVAAVLMLLKKTSSSASRPPPSRAPAQPALRRPLNDAQQQLFMRLHAALPSTMILVQPALAHLIDVSNDDAKLAVDFAICRKDSSPLAVVLLDEPNDAQRIEQLARSAGLRVARFRSGKLPADQDLKDALGFL